MINLAMLSIVLLIAEIAIEVYDETLIILHFYVLPKMSTP